MARWIAAMIVYVVSAVVAPVASGVPVKHMGQRRGRSLATTDDFARMMLSASAASQAEGYKDIAHATGWGVEGSMNDELPAASIADSAASMIAGDEDSLIRDEDLTSSSAALGAQGSPEQLAAAEAEEEEGEEESIGSVDALSTSIPPVGIVNVEIDAIGSEPTATLGAATSSVSSVHPGPAPVAGEPRTLPTSTSAVSESPADMSASGSLPVGEPFEDKDMSAPDAMDIEVVPERGAVASPSTDPGTDAGLEDPTLDLSTPATSKSETVSSQPTANSSVRSRSNGTESGTSSGSTSGSLPQPQAESGEVFVPTEELATESALSLAMSGYAQGGADSSDRVAVDTILPPIRDTDRESTSSGGSKRSSNDDLDTQSEPIEVSQIEETIVNATEVPNTYEETDSPPSTGSTTISNDENFLASASLDDMTTSLSVMEPSHELASLSDVTATLPPEGQSADDDRSTDTTTDSPGASLLGNADNNSTPALSLTRSHPSDTLVIEIPTESVIPTTNEPFDGETVPSAVIATLGSVPQTIVPSMSPSPASAVAESSESEQVDLLSSVVDTNHEPTTTPDELAQLKRSIENEGMLAADTSSKDTDRVVDTTDSLVSVVTKAPESETDRGSRAEVTASALLAMTTKGNDREQAPNSVTHDQARSDHDKNEDSECADSAKITENPSLSDAALSSNESQASIPVSDSEPELVESTPTETPSPLHIAGYLSSTYDMELLLLPRVASGEESSNSKERAESDQSNLRVNLRPSSVPVDNRGDGSSITALPFTGGTTVSPGHTSARSNVSSDVVSKEPNSAKQAALADPSEPQTTVTTTLLTTDSITALAVASTAEVTAELAESGVLDLKDNATTYVRGHTPIQSGLVGTDDRQAGITGSNTDGQAHIIGGRKSRVGDVSSGLYASSSTSQNVMRYTACIVSVLSVGLLLGFHFVRLDGCLNWPTHSPGTYWSPNTWEFVVYTSYLQQTMALSPMTLVQTPYFLWEFTDLFAWSNLLVYKIPESVVTDERRLGTIVLNSLVGYADRIGADETSLIIRVDAGFAVALAVVLALAGVLHGVDKWRGSVTTTSESEDSNRPFAPCARRLLGLCVLLWFFSLFPLTLIGSFEVVMEVQSGLYSSVSLVLSLVAVLVVSVGGLAVAGRSVLLMTPGAIDQPKTRAIWGVLYADHKYSARMFFVFTASLQIVTGMAVGAMQAGKTQLVLLLVLHGTFLLALLACAPFTPRAALARRFTYAATVIKLLNVLMAFAFLETVPLSVDARCRVARAFIVTNALVLMAWFLRHLVLFCTCVAVMSSHTDDESVARLEAGGGRKEVGGALTTDESDGEYRSGSDGRGATCAWQTSVSPLEVAIL